MKRAGNIYSKISEPDNLCLAFWKAARGKHDRREVMAFRNNFDVNIGRLRRQILDRRVEIGDYRFFYVFDPKKRLICAASFGERVLHHAVMNICEPALDSYAIYDSYACRKGKGGRKAIERSRLFSRKHPWHLKLDIARYFDSIDHDVLIRLLERRFKERDLLNLFRRILATYSTLPGRGLPIGNLISQHMANFYLGFFDHWVKEARRIRAYVRYMDDFIIWGREKKMLKAELERTGVWLRKNLGLELKDNIQLNRSSHGVPFLGYRVYPDRTAIAPSSKRRFVRKFRDYERKYLDGKWSEQTLCRHMEPLVESAGGADSAGFRKSVISRFGVLS